MNGGRIGGLVGMSASRFPMMFHSMWNFEGRVPRTGQVFKATGLYFFFTTKITRWVLEGEESQAGGDRGCLLLKPSMCITRPR